VKKQVLSGRCNCWEYVSMNCRNRVKKLTVDLVCFTLVDFL